MVIFQLREKAQISLDGHKVSTAHRIERETDKAVLLEVVHVVEGMDMKKVAYWLPKSQIKLDSETAEKATKIEIPNWLWEKKREAMDFAR